MNLTIKLSVSEVENHITWAINNGDIPKNKRHFFRLVRHSVQYNGCYLFHDLESWTIKEIDKGKFYTAKYLNK